MKLVMLAMSALLFAILGLSTPAPIFTTDAFANRMNGTATCGQMNCMQDRYYAAQKKASKGQKAK